MSGVESQIYVAYAAGPCRGAVAPPRSPAEDALYRVGDLKLNRLSRHLACGEDEPRSRSREFRLARISDEACRPGAGAHHALGEHLGLSFDLQTNVMDVHISRLRPKRRHSTSSNAFTQTSIGSLTSPASAGVTDRSVLLSILWPAGISHRETESRSLSPHFEPLGLTQLWRW
jgi:hypothetical protein